ncbi:MAG: putrescine ABC transporter permease PotH, partial [Pollutimonas bauzanensis]
MSKLSWRRAWPATRTWAIVPPFLWLLLFLLVPFILVLKISFADLKFGIPPYTSLAEVKDQTLSLVLNLRGYALLFSDSLYIAT